MQYSVAFGDIPQNPRRIKMNESVRISYRVPTIPTNTIYLRSKSL